jgi:hypothetical protein
MRHRIVGGQIFHAGEPLVMQHRMRIIELGEGTVQAVCECGWRSTVFGDDKAAGAMDALQQATDAGDLQMWDADLR